MLKEISIPSKSDAKQEAQNDFSNHVIAALALAMVLASEAIEITCIAFIIQFLQQSSSSYVVDMLAAAVYGGMLVGGVLSGYLADRYGRKICLLGSLFVSCTMGLLSAISPSSSWLILFRVVGGLGIGGSIPVTFSIGAELFPLSIRGRMLILISSFWMVGSLYTAIVALLMFGTGHQNFSTQTTWRLFLFACALPVMATIILVKVYVPEPLCALSTKNSNVISKEYSQLCGNVLGLFDEKFRVMSFALVIVWFTLSFVSFGMITWISVLFTDIGISDPYSGTLIFSIGYLPGNVLSYLLVDRMGRQPLAVLGMGVSAVSLVGFLISKNDAVLVILSSSLFNAASMIAWNCLDTLTAESYPTGIRSLSIGWMTAAGKVGSISAQYVYGRLLENLSVSELLCTNSLLLAIGMVAALALPNLGISSNTENQEYDVVMADISKHSENINDPI